MDGVDDRFEAHGPLETGVRRLVDAGIAVVAVAGNHDVEALPKLADRIDGFRLLGRGGVWESLDLATAAGVALRLWGWSFPQQKVLRSPLEGSAPVAEDGVVGIGLLHCDLDAAGGPYAPISRAQLLAVGIDAWLLGHIHTPDDFDGRQPLGYLGSLVGLDPGESGWRGPWLARIAQDGRVDMERQFLSPLRWEQQSVDVAVLDAAQASDIEDALGDLLQSGIAIIHDRLGPELGMVRSVGCRVRLTGRCRHHREIRHALATGLVADRSASYDDAVYFIEKIIDDSGPAWDLHALATSEDPPGLVARRLLALTENGTEADRLISGACREVEAATVVVRAHGGIFDDREEVRAMLLRSGLAVLEDLLADRDGGPT